VERTFSKLADFELSEIANHSSVGTGVNAKVSSVHLCSGIKIIYKLPSLE